MSLLLNWANYRRKFLRVQASLANGAIGFAAKCQIYGPKELLPILMLHLHKWMSMRMAVRYKKKKNYETCCLFIKIETNSSLLWA